MAFLSRVLRRRVAPLGLAGGALWLADDSLCHGVARRNLRAMMTGAILVFEYKLRWTPETSDEVHARVSKRLVNCMRENEGLYVKFGQALGTMDAILPEAYRVELRTMCDQAKTFPFRDVRRVIEADLGRPLEEMFSEFEEEPIASASIAQVHRARLRSPPAPSDGDSSCGDLVAVKVQKPNIPAQNGCDLAMYRLMLGVIEYAFELPMVWTYEYTRGQLEAELDFRIEAANAERCARDLDCCQHLKDRVVIPRVYGDVSGQRTLVMEWIDCLAPVSDLPALRQAGLDVEEVMRTATQIFGHQIFSTGHVHCDPHPGNLLVRRGVGREAFQIVLLDHGLYCELPGALRREYADFWVALALGDGAEAVRLCQGWGIADADAAQLFASLTQFRRVNLSAGRLGSVSSLFRPPSGQARPPLGRPRMTPEEAAAAQARLKARAQKVLADTSSFPQELFFVGRSLNMIRSANFSLGSVVNRVAVLAECAAAGAELGRADSRGQRLALFKFRFVVRSLCLLDRFVQAWRYGLGQVLAMRYLLTFSECSSPE